MDLKDYNLHHDTGFMLNAPLHTLPPYFQVWNELASAVPSLVESKRLREEVDKMPLLDHTKLDGYHQLRLARLQLSLLTSSYVWQDGDEGVPKGNASCKYQRLPWSSHVPADHSNSLLAVVLPRCLAIPLYKISEQLGVPPIMAHMDLIAANCTLLDPNGPYKPENVKCLYHMPGGMAPVWFCTTVAVTEFNFTKCLKPVARIVELVKSLQFLDKQDHSYCTMENEIAWCLDQIGQVLKTLPVYTARMRDHVTGKEFFNIIRPFLNGWGGEGNPMPEGLIYEGISDTPIKMHGSSAAQSTTLKVIDALLGVQHTKDDRQYLLITRQAILPNHRQFIEDIEQQASSFVDLVTRSTNDTLKPSYNQCLRRVIEFRKYHLGTVKKYIIIPSRQTNEGKYRSLDNRGTGGTSLIPFLKSIISATEKTAIVASVGNPTSLDQNRRSLYSWTVSRLLLTGAAILTLVVILQAIICK